MTNVMSSDSEWKKNKIARHLFACNNNIAYSTVFFEMWKRNQEFGRSNIKHVWSELYPVLNKNESDTRVLIE